jgi:dihydrodipicolinate synthase/N-acetylneuraminate lyase
MNARRVRSRPTWQQLVQVALIRDGAHCLVLMGTGGDANSLSAQEKHSLLTLLTALLVITPP